MLAGCGGRPSKDENQKLKEKVNQRPVEKNCEGSQGSQRAVALQRKKKGNYH